MRGCAISLKIVQESPSNILAKSFREVSAYFREVCEYFREVSAYFGKLVRVFAWKLVSKFLETSFGKFRANMATGGLEGYKLFFSESAKLGEEKLAFQKAPGKLEPRWQSTKVKLVTVKLVRCEKLDAWHSPLGPDRPGYGATKGS